MRQRQRLRVLVAVALVVLDATAAGAQGPVAAPNWTGCWARPSTETGGFKNSLLRVTQTGSRVTGTFNWGGGGKLAGSASGKVLTGAWSHTGGSGRGQVRLVLSSDGRSFTGTSKHPYRWTGHRAACWRPPPGTTWQWQLSDLPLDLSVDAAVFDVDLFETDASVVESLHRLGRRVICYVSVGTWEPGRPDSAAVPAAVRGKPLEDFPEERWLDVRRLDVLGPLVERRFAECRAKGFDAVEPDNVDGYANDTGFALTAADQLAFNRFVAREAHRNGLGVGLKNDLDQIGKLVADFDFAVSEQCAEFNECALLEPFVVAGKAVLHVEYSLVPHRFCPGLARRGFSSMQKRIELDSWLVRCPPA